VSNDEKYMQRCLELAALGNGFVAPNPLVGAVLVYENKIIGEGYHQQYGQAHAEVNCINSVAKENIDNIKDATLYVSLEPCNHFGKTPPCTHLIIDKKIKQVVIGCKDYFDLVNGSGIEFLQKNGVHVKTNILEDDCKKINKRFFTFHQKKRPYIILKFAQTFNKKIAGDTNERLFISNTYTNKLVHQWRSQEAAILVGTHTVVKDNPTLTNRHFIGKNPIRLIIDKKLIVPESFNIFNSDTPTYIFNEVKHEQEKNISYIKTNNTENSVHEILQFCYEQKITSLIVEGGAKLLQSFIDKGLWDEARVITNTELIVENGIKAPTFSGKLFNSEQFFSDTISYYYPTNS